MPPELDPKNFIQGAVARRGVVVEPLMVNGTVGLGGADAKDHTRLREPCLVSGTLLAEHCKFERGLQVNGKATLNHVKIDGPCVSAGMLEATETNFNGDLHIVAGGSAFLSKSRAQDLRLEVPEFKRKFLSWFTRWLRVAKITLEDSSIRNVYVPKGAKVKVVLKGRSAMFGRIIGEGRVKDQRPTEKERKAT